MTQLRRVDNLDIYCSDIRSMASFYTGVLGMPFFLPYRPESGWAAVQAENVTLFLFESPGAHPPRRTPVTEENAPGIDSFAFEVLNLDDAVAELDGNVEWADEVQRWEHPSGVWYRYRSFYDPEGNLLHITEPHHAHVKDVNSESAEVQRPFST